jgi:hypothetical protein
VQKGTTDFYRPCSVASFMDQCNLCVAIHTTRTIPVGCTTKIIAFQQGMFRPIGNNGRKRNRRVLGSHLGIETRLGLTPNASTFPKSQIIDRRYTFTEYLIDVSLSKKKKRK